MVQKTRQRAYFENEYIFSPDANAYAKLRAGRQVTPGTAAILEARTRAVEHDFISLSGVSVPLTNANNFGSYAALTFPNTNLKLFAIHLKGTFVLPTGQVASNFGFALGAAATASTDFSGTNEKTYIGTPARAATGTGVNGTVNFSSYGETSPADKVIKAGASNQVFINIAYASLAADINLIFNSDAMIELFWLDLNDGA